MAPKMSEDSKGVPLRSGGRGDGPKALFGTPLKPTNSRIAYMSMCMLGKTATVKTTDKSVYEGILYAFKEDGTQLHIVLKHAKTLETSRVPESKQSACSRQAMLVIAHSSISSINVSEVDLSGQDICAPVARDVSNFTDSDISADQSKKDRDLQAFVFDESLKTDGLEDQTAGNGWNADSMFQQNEAQFNVKSAFDESQYTVPVDMANAAITEAEAESIAHDIMTKATDNPHMREERGLVDDSGISEEDRYGAVMRRAQPEASAEDAGEQAPSRGRAWENGGGRGGGAGRGSVPLQSAWGRGAAKEAAGAREAATPGPPGDTKQSAGARADISSLRQSLANNRSLKQVVAPDKQQRYMNNVAAVDALNLIPGTGSSKFSKSNNQELATQLNDYKTRRSSGTNTNASPATAATLPAVSSPAAVTPVEAAKAVGGEGAMVGLPQPVGRMPRPMQLTPRPPGAKPASLLKFEFNPGAAGFKPGVPVAKKE